ncbi:MAG TPA: 3-dehydroquinate synthase [Kofleriaceae bacterium]|nr:3-dehydroquinate synthase [Kofleriaceae bacterium]
MPAPLFLIGFMAAGKTTVGRRIAEAARRRFVDLDDVISAQGEPVPELVARDEAEFRRREAAALAATIFGASDGPVIATGGGAATFGDNLERMKAAGCVVALTVDLDEAQERAVGGTKRPLLASGTELVKKRAPIYRQAHAVIDTTGLSIEAVVELVEHAEWAWHRLPLARRDATILPLGPRSYPISVYDDPIDAGLLRAYLDGASKVAVITDEHVARHWQGSALRALPGAEVIAIAPGEANKSLDTYRSLSEELIRRGLDRGSAIVALGGGVVGDLAGFVASTFLRGVPVIQLPTTLVAMTDAAIGGKTAVDLPAGKNLIGAFWQPKLVGCGLATLATLPVRERRAGFGELWKYALLDGPSLWQLVEACAAWAAADDGEPDVPAALHEVIRRSIAYKAAIVARDERELTGHRALLNLGHTVGHAIESETGLHHGEAVGLGLVAAARVSAALVGAAPALETEVTAALRRTGLPADLDRYLTDETLDRIKVDKKRIGDKVRFIAIREVGACDPVEITVTELRRILRRDPAP